MNAPIERVIVQNLNRRVDKWRACYAALLDAGVPPEIIERFSALDSKKMSPDLLYHDLLMYNYDFHQRANAKFSETCSDYTYFRILNKIRNTQKKTLLMLDDQRITTSFAELNQIQDFDFDIFQLTWYTKEEEESVLIEPIAPRRLISKGLLGYGIEACIYTPNGAKRARKQFESFGVKYRLEDSLRQGDLTGYFTSIIPLATDIGGKEYWESDQ